jgi:hypothetical protein
MKRYERVSISHSCRGIREIASHRSHVSSMTTRKYECRNHLNENGKGLEVTRSEERDSYVISNC